MQGHIALLRLALLLLLVLLLLALLLLLPLLALLVMLRPGCARRDAGAPASRAARTTG
jgi:hypothetical protein